MTVRCLYVESTDNRLALLLLDVSLSHPTYTILTYRVKPTLTSSSLRSPFPVLFILPLSTSRKDGSTHLYLVPRRLE
jgi:hypothetical protein